MLNSEALHNLEGCFERPVPPGQRRIAWNGISFCVPTNWELAVYKFLRRGACRIELEDEYSIRVEAEWIRTGKRIRLDRIMKRYEDASKSLTLKSDERIPVENLPDGWYATHFVFKESGVDEENPRLSVRRHDLVTAFYLDPGASIFCFFILHFLPEDHEDPIGITRQLAHSFQNHGEAPFTPWQLFDIAFKMPRDFELLRTQFDIGVKLMIFGWKWRLLYLWHFSCADIFLENGITPQEWACGYLNGFGGINGPMFYPGRKGEMTWKRRRPYLFGHRHEIARLCYRYDVGCELSTATNQLVVWVFHHRRADDLKRLPS